MLIKNSPMSTCQVEVMLSLFCSYYWSLTSCHVAYKPLHLHVVMCLHSFH